MDEKPMKTIKYEIPFIRTIGEYHFLPSDSVYQDKGVRFPVLFPIMVHRSLVVANDYNPNHVAKDKMELLRTSIVENGFCFGIVAIYSSELEKFVIVDGYHRSLIASEQWLGLEFYPLIVLTHVMEKRLAATVQFNKARGVHKIDLNAELVKRMVELGMADLDICKQLGIDADEFLRLKRNVRIADVYKDLQFSKSWEVSDADSEPENHQG